ncbi:peptidase domain-containing ABC transporter [uncultured Sphingomonas sp.]|uniref:peptidase domain-containing ABC transporter n=1 Tax=uncultured Sphingomonas sp. TaxID=158754 RepID=UPI0025ED2560|nr:peptidase domain-containing ABC transporter [uncultured Sphingomonas sp.]
MRLIRQTEVSECGLASLTMIANFHGMKVDLGTLRRSFSPSLRGAPLKSLMNTADQLGFSSRAVKLSIEDIGNLAVPAILHWDMNHYVVLERVIGASSFGQASIKALIHDPAGQSKWLPLAELSKHFTGVALELTPGDDFQPSVKRQRLSLKQLWWKVHGLKRAFAQTLVLSVLMQGFVLASPYYMQVAIDRVLPAQDRDLLVVLALGFGLFAIINVVSSLLRSFVLLSAGTSLSFGIATNITRRLFRLPVDWFEKRHVGDVLSRFQSIAPIQQALTQGAVAVLIDGLLGTVILAVMFLYSAALTAVALAAFAVYATARYAAFSFQREAQESAMIARSKEQSMMIESLRGIVTLRLLNRENTRHAQWQTRLNDAANADITASKIGIWVSTGNTLIFGMEAILATYLAIGFVIDGGFSVGMVFAYLSYKTQFIQRANSLIDQAIGFRMLGLHLERLADIAMSDEDNSFRSLPSGIDRRFAGKIELRDVHFRYSPTDRPVLSGVNLTVEPGEHIAITGPSGGGKSTLVKIILGLLEPTEGAVLIDGIPLNQFGYKEYRDQISAVLQDDNIFAGSIADNIALFEDTVLADEVITAANAAAIHDDIYNMPMRYETLVGDMGSSLSGGQRQRVLLARALYRKPKALVLDEGTSHLDVAHERLVNRSVSERNITRIIVAHRKETIQSAEKVYALAHGVLLDCSKIIASQPSISAVGKDAASLVEKMRAHGIDSIK